MSDSDILIVCKDVTIAYDKIDVIEDISFNVKMGDYISIVGENGSGKSSLVKGILGLVPVRTGEIIYGNGVTKRNIGYLPQLTMTKKDFPASVNEVVLSGCLTNTGFRPFFSSKDKKTAKNNMEKLGIANLAKKTYGELSGGQKQRVLLARALCATDKILFMDEPITGLDPIVTAEFYEVVSKLNKEENMSIVMISHDIDNAMKYSDKILHLKDKGYFFGTKEEYKNSEFGKVFMK